jgi:hypothetical protein
MREGPSSAVLSGAAGWYPTAASWLDGRNLATSIPITSGKLTVSVASQVPESLTFVVPEVVDGYSWVPDSATHPLAQCGQAIEVGINVTAPVSGEVTWTRLGKFRVHSWEHDDRAGSVSVSCVGVLGRVAEDRFVNPEVPRSGGTLGSEFRRLMSPGIPVSIDSALSDRACPQSFQWAQDRLDALYDIADAWPARLRTDQYGQVQLLAPLPEVPVPVLELTDGVDGTLVGAPRSDTRDKRPNVIVATSSATDSTALDPVAGTARVSTGPLAANDDGTGYGRVVEFYSSPLITTDTQAYAAAVTRLAAVARPAVVRTVMCAPDPRVELDDAVAVTRDGVTEWGVVIGYDLPLTIGGGAMRIDVGIS